MGKILMFISTILLASCTVKQFSKGYFKQNAKNSVNFDFDQTQLVMNADSASAMKLWLVTDEDEYALLRKQSDDVLYDETDEVLNRCIDRLYATVVDTANAGVGIAAPQVGISKNIIWVQRFDKVNYPFEVYLNPKITRYSDQKQPCREGCLSIPNRSDTLNVRSMTIEITYMNTYGNMRTESITGFTAVVFQHEIDHLNGVLYTDYLEN